MMKENKIEGLFEFSEFFGNMNTKTFRRVFLDSPKVQKITFNSCSKNNEEKSLNEEKRQNTDQNIAN